MLWSIGQFPELDHLDQTQRVAVLKKVPWIFYPGVIIGSICWGILTGVFSLALTFWLPFEAGIIVSAMLAILVTLNSYLSQLNKVRIVIRSEIAKAFAYQRPPFCFSCGYDFRNLTSDTCPECGQHIST